MKPISKKNIRKFPTLHNGDKIVVINSKMSILNGKKGVVIEADKRGRSPYKSIHKVMLRDSDVPWYLFGNELLLSNDSETKLNGE